MIDAVNTAFELMTNGASVFDGTMVPRTSRSLTITELSVGKLTKGDFKVATRLVPIPPGEILLEEFMRPLAVSQNRLARDLSVPVARINDIVHAKRGISADTALRLAAYFGTTPEFWLNLQTRYDLKLVSAAVGDEIRRAVRPMKPQAA